MSVSLVSTINGFEHDLKKICDLAHAHGAYVYADIVHAAGAVPMDLRATGVDFAATSSYKWLMGDFGLGFLYVRKEVQEKVRRPWWGYHQVGAVCDPRLPARRSGTGGRELRGTAERQLAASPWARLHGPVSFNWSTRLRG